MQSARGLAQSKTLSRSLTTLFNLGILVLAFDDYVGFKRQRHRERFVGADQ